MNQNIPSKPMLGFTAEYAAGDVSASELADCIIDYEGEKSWDND